MTDLISTWHAEHANFARLLDILEREVAVFGSGGHPNYDLMLDVVYYLCNYSDQVHHRQEDVAFARLLDRDPELKPQIDKLVQEHYVIAAAGSALLEHLNSVVCDALEPRSLIEAAAATYVTYYRQHIETEDKKLIPRAAQLLTRQDWSAVTAAVPQAPDPLRSEDAHERYRRLRRQIALEAHTA